MWRVPGNKTGNNSVRSYKQYYRSEENEIYDEHECRIKFVFDGVYISWFQVSFNFNIVQGKLVSLINALDY